MNLLFCWGKCRSLGPVLSLVDVGVLICCDGFVLCETAGHSWSRRPEEEVEEEVEDESLKKKEFQLWLGS